MAPSAGGAYPHGVHALDFLSPLFLVFAAAAALGAVVRWAVADARKRGRPGWAVALLLVAAPIVGWLFWLALRPTPLDSWRRDPIGLLESRQGHLTFAGCLALAWYNTGTIWTAQRVLYPLKALVGQADYYAYDARFAELMQLPIVTMFSLLLLVTAVLLWSRPAEVPEWAVWFGAFLEGMALASSMTREVPLLSRMGREGFSEALNSQVIAVNWVRTWAITAHALLLSWMALRVMAPKPLIRVGRWGG
jgi:hypothetical protein